MTNSIDHLIDTTKGAFSGVPLWQLGERPGVFVDCGIYDNDELYFMRFFGRDASLNNLIASFYLPVAEGGLSNLTLLCAEKKTAKAVLLVGDTKELAKHNGRVSRQAAPEFADLGWLWIYNKRLCSPDLTMQTNTVLVTKDLYDKGLDDQIWQTVRRLSSIPLQDAWRDYVMQKLRDIPAVIEELSSVGDVIRAVRVSLPPNFDEMVCSAIQDGSITPMID